jgi:hypothetical protein
MTAPRLWRSANLLLSMTTQPKLGSWLATRTLLAAEVRGFDQFVAQVLHENVGVMRLLDHVGVVISMRTRREVSEVTFVRRGRGEQRD